MTATPQPWLPPAAVERGLDRACAAAAHDWSGHWLAASELRLHARSPDDREDPTWRVAPNGIALGIGAGAGEALAKRLLAAPTGAPVAAGDRHILAHVTEAALHDLLRRLAAAAGRAEAQIETAPHRPTFDGAHERWLGFDDGASILCVVERSAAIAMARPTGIAAGRTKLGSIAAALAPEPVDLIGRIGGCVVTLADLAALEPGDVILLDRAVGEPVELTLRQSSRSLARCVVETDDERLSLKLLDPIDR